jgi:hypothetical protein
MYGENCKASYKLWRGRNPKKRINVDAKLLLNQKNYILKAKSITTRTDATQEDIRLHIRNDK